MRLLLLTLLIPLLSCCATTPAAAPNVRAKPVTCFLSLPPTLSLLPADWATQDHQHKAITLLDLHVDDGVNYAQALTELGDCREWIQETP